MKEQAPTTPPEVSPNQDQLFNPDLYAEQQDRETRAMDTIKQVTQLVNGEEAAGAATPGQMSDVERQSHQDALDMIKNGGMPEAAGLKRDWSDNLKQHEEKVAAHNAKLVERLERRLKVDEVNAGQAERIEVHNEEIKARKAEAEARDEVRQAHISRQKLLKGTMNLTPEDEARIAKEADAVVEEKLGPAKVETDAADMADVKEASAESQAKRQAEADQRGEDLKNFYKNIEPAKGETEIPGYEFDVATAERVVHGSDKLLRNDSKRLYAVIEGLHGETEDDVRGVASQVVHDAMNEYWENQSEKTTPSNAVDQMKEAFTHAQAKLREAAEAGQGDPDMGAVMSAVRFFQNPDGSWSGVIGHVGDTRLYIQAADGRPVEQLTTDEANEKGTINYLDTAEDSKVSLAQFSIFNARPDMRFGFVTDGIYGLDDEERLSAEDFQKAFDIPSTQKAADALLEASRTEGDAAAMIVDFSKELNGDEPVPPKPEDGPGDDTEAMPADTKGRMGWAARQLKKLRDFRDSSAARFTNRNVGRDGEYNSKRRKIMAGVAGALVAGGLGYAIYKIGYNIGHDDPSSTAHDTLNSWDIQPPASVDHAAHVAQVNEGVQHGVDAASAKAQAAQDALHDGVNHAAEQLQQHIHVVADGENPWNISRDYLQSMGVKPSMAQIDAFNDQLLALNGLDEESAKHIFVGTELKMPQMPRI